MQKSTKNLEPLGSVRQALESYSLLPDDARIKGATVCALLACSRVTLWRRVKDGEFPEPMREGYNVIRWRVGDVRKHLAAGRVAS